MKMLQFAGLAVVVLLFSALPAFAAIEQGADDILVIFGDTPLIRPQTLEKLRTALAGGAAVAVLGFAMAIPVLSVESVSAAKSVASIGLKAGSTPISERSVVPDRNWRMTVVNASEGE